MDLSEKPTVGYTLYLYREELRRPQARYTRLNKTKLTLTDNLINKCARNLKQCSREDLQAITREIQFKTTLTNQLQRLRNLEKLGLRNVSPNLESTDL
uniref:SERTA domain-containing protein n=1 Tax=Musca domestica TaxID=7370 RepID=A0A1I8MND1_MUSDO